MITNSEIASAEYAEKVEIHQTCLAVLNSIRDFDINQVRGMTLDRQREVLLENKALNQENYDLLKKDSYLCRFIGHDLGNLAANVLGNTQMLVDQRRAERWEQIVEKVLENWPRYALIMQDICLRGLDQQKVDSKFMENFDRTAALETLHLLQRRLLEKLADKKFKHQNYRELAKSPASRFLMESSARLDVSVNLQRLEIKGEEWLESHSGEKIKTVTGVVINAISNIIRNAAGEYLVTGADGKPLLDEHGLPKEKGAKNVVLEIAEEQNGEKKELVFSIMDDGQGMPPDYLSQTSDKYIFREGRSHRQSSGYGLTNMPERLESVGAHLRVWTRERDRKDQEESFFDNESRVSDIAKTAERERWIKETGFNPSTVFEIRLLIRDKELLS